MAGLSFQGILIVSLIIYLLEIVNGQVVPNGTNTALSNINMTQLLQSLNMTQSDLKQMQQQIAKNNSVTTNNAATQQQNIQTPQGSNTTPVQTQANITSTNSSTQGTNIDTSGFMDLSSLEQRLGIRPATIATASVTSQSNNNSTQQNTSQNSAGTSSSSNTNSASNGQIALQGPIPIVSANHLSTSSQTLSQASATLDFLDLSSLQKQLGLIPSTASTNKQTNTSSLTPAQNTTQQQTKASPSSNNTSNQNNSTVERKPTQTTSTSQQTLTSSPSNSSSGPSTSSGPSSALTPPSLNTSMPSSNRSNQSIQNSSISNSSLPLSNVSSSSNLTDQTAQLYSQLAKLQDLLDQLTNKKTSPTINPLNSSSSPKNNNSNSSNVANTTLLSSDQNLTSAISQSSAVNQTSVNQTSTKPINNQTAITNSSQQPKPVVLNSSLPQMIDLSKANVIFSIYNQTQSPNSTTISQQNSNASTRAPEQNTQPVQNKSTPVVPTQPIAISLPVINESNVSNDNKSQVQVVSKTKESLETSGQQDQRNNNRNSSVEAMPTQGNRNSSSVDTNTQAAVTPDQSSNLNQSNSASNANATFPPMIDLSKAQVIFSIYNNSKNTTPTVNQSVTPQKQPVQQSSDSTAISDTKGSATSETNTSRNLPPMIDITKANVIFSIYNQTNQNFTQSARNFTQVVQQSADINHTLPSNIPLTNQKQPVSTAPSQQEPVKAIQQFTPAASIQKEPTQATPTQQNPSSTPNNQKEPVPTSTIKKESLQPSTATVSALKQSVPASTQKEFANTTSESNLPPMIDISKATVIYSIYNTSQNTSSSSSQPASIQPQGSQSNKSVAPVPTKQENLNSVTLTVPPAKPTTSTSNVQTNQRPATAPEGRPSSTTSTDKSMPTTSAIPHNWPYSIYPDVESFVRASAVSRLDPRFQNNQNQVSQPSSQNQVVQANNQQITRSPTPITTPTPTPPSTPMQNQQPSPRPSQNLQRQPQNTIQSYQYQLTSKLAIYTLKTNYKTFSESFILSLTDPYLPRLQSYLSLNYANYIKQGTLIAGFKLYQDYDNSIQYQLLYSTIFGTFNAFISYNPYTDALILKSLSVISFPILDITLQNCMTPDSSKSFCQICSSGYRNFMGRCRLYDAGCLQYLTDQCGACMQGYQLIRGSCSK